MEKENHEFTMQVTAYGKTVSIAQIEDAVDIHEFLDMCRALAISIGYHESSWEDGVIDMADSYTEERRNPNNGEELLDNLLAKDTSNRSDLVTNWGLLNSHNC
jgi:hypothetical protein